MRVPNEQHVVDALLEAYRQGAFPMGDEDAPYAQQVQFYTALRRGIVPLDPPGAAQPSRRLLRTMRSGRFQVTSDIDFEGVVRACAEPRPDDEDGTWLTEPLIQWALLLHRYGHAHSVEAWRDDPASGRRELVGGIYGVTIGGAFFGESMFHRMRPRLESGERHPLDGTDAGKACFFALADHLRLRGFVLFDTQFINDHIATLGCVEVSAEEYLDQLDRAVELDVGWGGFEAASLPCLRRGG
jgi:leucyl/phenylalanyl-tRNA---protein transferase